MPNKLKLIDLIFEDQTFADFVTAGGEFDWKNKIPDQVFGKNDPTKRRGTDVSNREGGLAQAIAQAAFTGELAKADMVDIGLNPSDLKDQDTIDYYKSLKRFPFIFSINKPIEGYFNNESSSIEGFASVDQRSNAKKFVIYFTDNNTKEVYRFNFLPKSLQKNLMGTDFDLPMLIKNEDYDVRISLKDFSNDGGWGEPGTNDPEKEEEKGPSGDSPEEEKGPSGDSPEEEKGPSGEIDPDDSNPPVPPEIKKNRNEIFRLLLKNYGKYNGDVVYGDGFLNKKEAAEYQKLLRKRKKGEIEKSEVEEFRRNSSRNKYSMMIANLRKSFPSNFLKKLDKAFPEFNLSYQKQVEESFDIIKEETNKDKYKRWSIVFGKDVGNKTIDELDKNIRGFMAAVKKWFASPIIYRGKTQSYNIDFDGDKVNEYWKNFYGSSKKEESFLSIGNVLTEILTERKPPKKKGEAPENRIGKGDYWEDKKALGKYFDRKLIINDIPTFRGDKSTLDVVSNKKPQGEIVVGSIDITDGGGNPTWAVSGAEDIVNNELKKGVLIRDSKSVKDTFIIEWKSNVDIGGKPTKAMLIKPKMNVDDFTNKVKGSGVVGVEVEIGRKVGADESMANPAKGKITLKVKK